MKKFRSAICVAIIAGVSCVAGQMAFAATDINSHWAFTTIQKWIAEGRISGYPDDTFRPNNNITRAEYISLLSRCFGYSTMGSAQFTDVSPSHWAYASIQQAVYYDVASGYENGSFGPERYVSRQEAAVMLSKAMLYSQNESAANSFNDSYAMPTWSKGYIGSLTNTGIISGRPDGSFGPTDNLTRAEAVIMLDKAYTAASVSNQHTPTAPADTTTNNNGYGDYELTETRLTNETVYGDLIIPSSMDSSSITLNNVTVRGKLIVRGGSSIHAIGCDIKELSLNKDGVTFKAGDNTVAALTVFENNGEISGEGYDKVRIDQDGLIVSLNAEINELVLDADSDLKLRADADIRHFEAAKNADSATIQFNTGAAAAMDLYAPVQITGTGKINLMNVYVSGVRSSIRPATVSIKGNADPPTFTDSGSNDDSSSSSNDDNLTISKSNANFDGNGKHYNKVTIGVADADISNFIVMGDLTINPSVGDGTVELTNVEVRGNVYINGGGSNSVILRNCSFKKDIICNSRFGLAVKFGNGNSVLGTVNIRQSTTLSTIDGSTLCLGNVSVIGTDATLTLEMNVNTLTLISRCTVHLASGHRINTLDVEMTAKNSVLYLYNSYIDNLCTYGDISIEGTGTIGSITGGNANVQTGNNITINTDKSGLNTAIDQAVSLRDNTTTSSDGKDVARDEYWVTSSVMDSFIQKIIAAQSVVNSSNASQVTVNNAKTDLENAISDFDSNRALGLEADKTALNAVLQEAVLLRDNTFTSSDGKDVARDKYWVISQIMDSFTSVIATAQGVYESPNASQDTVNNAKTDLENAISDFDSNRALGLEVGPLTEAIATAETLYNSTAVSDTGEDIDHDKYWTTQLNKSTFNSVIEAAKYVANKSRPTADEIQTAISDLAAATESFESGRQNGLMSTARRELFNLVETYTEYVNRIKASEDGTDIPPTEQWNTQQAINDFKSAIAKAEAIAKDYSKTDGDIGNIKPELEEAVGSFRDSCEYGTLNIT